MIEPRRWGHRGTVVATGFVIDPSLAGWAEAKRRSLAVWEPGAAVHEHQGLLLVTRLSPARVRAATAPGTPLVLQHGVLAALPLDPDEASEIASPGAVVVVRGGVIDIVRLEDAREVDLSAWIDLGELSICRVEPLAAPPTRVELPPPPNTDVRSVTGAPPADAGVKDVVEALTLARTPGLARPSRWLQLVRWLEVRIAPRPETGPTPPALSWSGRLRARLAASLWRSRLGAVLGRRHAAHLRRTLEMFDRGELDEALRHAVPLRTGGGDERLTLGLPARREDLRLSFAPRSGGTSLPVADQIMDLLRARYRAAATRLEQAGRIDEAAFALAELLVDVEGAIALLERHARYAVAARLAEARGLEPGLIVRLWFLAGDRDRAIDTARRHQAWGDAVERLERSGDERAPALRMTWAEHLAGTGNFAQAVEVAWPVASARTLVEAWIDRGIAAEGTVAARMLVKKLVLAPSSFPAIAPAVLATLGASDPEAGRQRIALVDELIRAPVSPELQTLARPALRALVRDHGLGVDGVTSQLVDRLVRFADDAALRADRPSLTTASKPTRADRDAPIELGWSAHDMGALPVHDAVVLPGDRLLLALGELGVRIVGRDGRTLSHIDQPATRLVISDHGTRALALTARGQVQRIARLELIPRRGAHWLDAEVDGGAPTFDGDLWIATRGREVFAIDTTASRWRAVWGVDVEPGTRKCTIRRDGGWFAIEALADDGVEVWFYDGFTLRRRESSPVGDPEVVGAEIAGKLVVITRRAAAGLVVTARDIVAEREIARLALDGARTASVRLTGHVLAIGDDRGRVTVLDLQHGLIRHDLRIR